MKLKKLEISERVVQRLTEYLSILKEARKQDNEINSIELAKIMNTTSAQVRKDLSTFGEFGVRGKGYDVDKLIEIITEILGIDKINNVIIVGHGKMGEMLSSNLDVLGEGFKIVGIFDKDSNNKLKNQWKGELIHNILAKSTCLYRCTPILPCHNTITSIITQRLSDAWNYFT